MKKHTFTLVLLCLLFLSSSLMGQKAEGRFKLNEGDWFEVQVENINQTFLLRYQLEKQFSNGNQQYNISLQRYVVRFISRGLNFGYDSYYPVFDENKRVPDTKRQYQLEITPKGEIINFEPFDNYDYTFGLYQISPKMSEMVYWYSQSINKNFGGLKQDISILTQPIYNPLEKNNDQMVGIIDEIINDTIVVPYLNKTDSVAIKVPYLKESGVPLFIKLMNKNFILTAASFPLPSNSIIHGKLSYLINQDISISLAGPNTEGYFLEKRFKTKSDGSFQCPLFLNRPLQLVVKIGKKTLTTFMEPGDTLNISALGNQANYDQTKTDFHFWNTVPNGYFALGRNKSGYFTGSAAYNTMLSNEIDQFRSFSCYDEDIHVDNNYWRNYSKRINSLIDSYKGKASGNCIRFFQRDWNYFVAVDKLTFFTENLRRFSNPTNPNPNYKNEPVTDYPKDFFLVVDTLPILMYPYEWSYAYQNYLKESQNFKYRKLGLNTNRSIPQRFQEYYYFSKISLLGYPFYEQIGYKIDENLKGGKIEEVEKYYTYFLNSCLDPALTEPLKLSYQQAVQLKKGNRFPINSLVLKDSSIFSLEQYKGKTICLIIIGTYKHDINEFKEIISKFQPGDIEFVFAKMPNIIDWDDCDPSILEKPNVTYIELAEQDLKSKLLLKGTKIFILDKWFRIADNNAENPVIFHYQGGVSNFEKSLRKTIESKRYSKAELDTMKKRAGSIIVAILGTLLMVLGINGFRIQRIKKQEAAKRRIKELEIKAVRSQMNPHFIFNALNSIQSLINGNQYKEANIYLSKFAVLLRGVLNNSEKPSVTLSDELKAVELYCQLEQLRFEFVFELTIDPDINVDLIEIPGMIIQPLVENAIVHGLSSKGQDGLLIVQVQQQNGKLQITVSDNGVGLNSQKTDELRQKGFGLKLVEERINILNLDGKEARLVLNNNTDGTGTRALLILPID
ncbi:MAG: sensor histidine kinase [Prolixibacteraceae bacterium]